MPPKKKTGKQATDAADKKKATSNMLGQCKLARQKLEAAKAQGDQGDPSLVEDLERKVAFLAEYEALPLRDKKKDAMLQSWSQDKSLKSWAEMHCNYTQDKGTESRDRSNYGTKQLRKHMYEVAAMLKLDVKDPAQKRILEETLKDMDSDSDWDESNPLEMAMKKQKLRRYTWTKHEGTEHTMGSKESTSVVVSKDVTKHVAQAGLKMITEGASSATGTTPSVKIEHVWVLPAENLLKDLNTLLAKLKGYTSAFKKSRVQLKASPKAAEAPDLSGPIQKLDELEHAILELTMKDPKKMDENECKTYVEQCQSTLQSGNLVKDMSEEMKKKCNGLLRTNSSSSIK
ncbi:unnamed protein product [Symbiodinium sp. CCMP2592]|nr:unnamed protein product [Symbiodinium sp. CCMP2592]